MCRQHGHVCQYLSIQSNTAKGWSRLLYHLLRFAPALHQAASLHMSICPRADTGKQSIYCAWDKGVTVCVSCVRAVSLVHIGDGQYSIVRTLWLCFHILVVQAPHAKCCVTVQGAHEYRVHRACRCGEVNHWRSTTVLDGTLLVMHVPCISTNV